MKGPRRPSCAAALAFRHPGRPAGRPALALPAPGFEPHRLARAAAPVLAGLLALLVPRVSAAADPVAAPTQELVNADGWAAQPPDAKRDKILERWAASATLPELMWVLRHPADRLGSAEGMLVDRALQLTPRARAALRTRLVVRLAACDPRRARRYADEVGSARVDRVTVRASVFRVGTLLPLEGPYADFAAAVRAGLDAGLAAHGPAATRIEVRNWNTGDDEPARAIAALDSAAGEAGALVGELLSGTTLMLAAGARFLGTPLVSPTATDENIGALGAGVFQIGPSSYERGRRLAEGVVASGRRVAVLTSESSSSTLARGFTDGAAEAGAQIVWRSTYPSGSTGFKDASRELAARQIEVLFWDGDPREAEPLLRQLTRDRVTLRICGGQALAPEQFHEQTRFLLEGIQYVGDEWKLADALRTQLARALEPHREEPGPLHVRGFLVGRLLGAAVASGALCPEEVTDYAASRRASNPYLAAHGFLGSDSAMSIPIFTVAGGKGVAAVE